VFNEKLNALFLGYEANKEAALKKLEVEEKLWGLQPAKSLEIFKVLFKC